MHTTSYGSEVEWEITSSLGVICEGGHGGVYKSDDVTKVSDCKFGNGQYTLRCIDTYGDGWHGGYLLIHETKHCESFTSGHL